jgi:hypothetical protein
MEKILQMKSRNMKRTDTWTTCLVQKHHCIRCLEECLDWLAGFLCKAVRNGRTPARLESRIVTLCCSNRRQSHVASFSRLELSSRPECSGLRQQDCLLCRVCTVCVRALVGLYRYVYLRMYISVYMCTYVCVWICACLHVFVFVRVYLCLRICMHVYMHVWTYARNMCINLFFFVCVLFYQPYFY